MKALKINLQQLNYHVIRKQHLAAAPESDDIVKIVQDVSGLHATGATTPYLSLLARCRTFRKEDLDAQLYRERTLGRVRCMRKTIFVLSKEMIPIAQGATRNMVVSISRRYMQARAVSLAEFDRVSKAIMALLAGREMTASAIKQALGSSLDISAILQLMCDQGQLVRGRPEKGWRDNRYQYALFSEYFPDLEPGKMDETAAITRLVHAYLSSFGPASENDVIWWTGLGKKKVCAALGRLKEQISQVHIMGLDGEAIMLHSDAESLDRFPPPEPVVNFLPYLDPYIMGYKDRARYLDFELHEFAFDRSGNATSTILVDGRVVGVWDIQHQREVVLKIFLFKPLKGAAFQEINAHAARVAEFVAGKGVMIEECESMAPLRTRPAGGFMSPLRSS